MSRAPANFIQINDAVGTPVSGGLLYTYAAGTTNNKATYVSQAAVDAVEAGGDPATGANANPLVAGADGIVGPVFMLRGDLYKFVQKTAAGDTLRTEDNLSSAMTTSDDLITRVKQIASNPVDYGAVGDGAADESAEVQDAIDNATASGVVDLLGLTFRCDSQIVLNNGITLKNGTLDFRNCTATEFIKAHGTLESVARLLTADAAMVAQTLSLDSVNGLAVGDLLNVYSNAAYIDTILRGELHEIESINVLDVGLSGVIMDEYAVASGASVVEVTPVEDVTLDNVTVLGTEGIAGAHYMLSLVNTRRVKVRNCTFNGIDYVGIMVAASYSTKIENCTFLKGNTAGVGVVICEASRYAAVQDCLFSNVLMGISVGAFSIASAATGIPRNVDIVHNTIRQGGSAGSSAIYSDAETQFVKIYRNQIETASSAASRVGIEAYGVDLDCSENNITVISAATGQGIYANTKVPNRSTWVYTLRFNRNQIFASDTGIVLNLESVVGGSGRIEQLEIQNNNVVLDTVAAGGIALSSDIAATIPTVGNLVIRGNIGNQACGISVACGDPAMTVDVAYIEDNICSDLTISGATLSIARLLSGNNHVLDDYSITSCATVISSDDSVVGHMLIDECQAIHVRDATVTDGLEIDNNSVAFTRCDVNGGYYANTAAIPAIEVDASAAGTAWLQVRNCNMLGTAPGAANGVLHITGDIDFGTVRGNSIRRSDDVYEGIHLAGDGAGLLTEFNVLGNWIYNGSVGLAVTNHTTVRQSGNAFVSCVAEVTGTITPLVAAGAYTVTNGTTDRTYDADAAVVAELCDIVYSLLNDLATAGIVSRS